MKVLAIKASGRIVAVVAQHPRGYWTVEAEGYRTTENFISRDAATAWVNALFDDITVKEPKE